MKIRLVILAALSLCARFSIADDNEATVERLLGEAEATLTVNDLQWLDRTINTFASTSGANPASARSVLAQTLFRSKSLEGIDITRPALLAWRPGSAPLLAIIPITNRRSFVDNFGAVPGMAEPLVRVNERNGTIVYTQNTSRGVYEYRLLVQDNNAFLARSPEECHLLAARRLQASPDGPPLSFQSVGSYFSITGTLPIAEQLAALPQGKLLTDTLGYAVGQWNEMLNDISNVAFTFVPKEEGVAQMRLVITPKADTAIAQWMGGQKNQSSRLLPAVKSAASVLTVHGSIAWQGKLERIGIKASSFLRDLLGAEVWSLAVEDEWHSLWTLADKQGAFAAALDVGDAQKPIEFKAVTEQPEGAAMMKLTQEMLSALSMPQPDVETIAIEGMTAQRDKAAGMTSSINGERVQAANDTHMFTVVTAAGEGAELVKKIEKAVEGSLEPQGEPAVIGLQFDLTKLLSSPLVGAKINPATAPSVVVDLAISTNAQAELDCSLTLPYDSMSALLRDSGVIRGSDPAPEPQNKPQPGKRR